jgi:hypothetical protein
MLLIICANFVARAGNPKMTSAGMRVNVRDFNKITSHLYIHVRATSAPNSQQQRCCWVHCTCVKWSADGRCRRLHALVVIIASSSSLFLWAPEQGAPMRCAEKAPAAYARRT